MEETQICKAGVVQLDHSILKSLKEGSLLSFQAVFPTPRTKGEGEVNMLKLVHSVSVKEYYTNAILLEGFFEQKHKKKKASRIRIFILLRPEPVGKAKYILRL